MTTWVHGQTWSEGGIFFKSLFCFVKWTFCDWMGKCSGVQQTKVTWDSPQGYPAEVVVEGPDTPGPQIAGLWLFCSLPHKDKICKPADCLSSGTPAINNWNLQLKIRWHTHLHTITPEPSAINLTHYEQVLYDLYEQNCRFAMQGIKDLNK